jgi:spore maturation protein CgeB
MRCNALRNLGHELVEIDGSYVPAGIVGLAMRVCRRLNYSLDTTRGNERLLASIGHYKPSLVWIDKGLCITPRTLQAARAILPNVQIVHYSPDDMGGRHNQSRQYLTSIPHYDLHVTTKSFNVEELYGLGARAVLFVNKAYSDETHRPIEISSKDSLILGGSVGFIGAFERERADSLLFLAKHGVKVRVWGAGWGSWKKRNLHPNLVIEDRCLWGEEYARAICSFDINLGFLRKLNRDLQTSRSIEIPACGRFMLAERTSEHLGLFAEGVEAEFFSNNEELLEKCRYYLSHVEEREKIGTAGRLRCLRSGYRYERHVQTVIDRLKELSTHAGQDASDALLGRQAPSPAPRSSTTRNDLSVHMR